jgi:hypothetical protein
MTEKLLVPPRFTLEPIDYDPTVHYRWSEEFDGGTGSASQVGRTGMAFGAVGAGTGSCTRQGGVASHPGIYRLDSGATSGTLEWLAQSGGATNQWRADEWFDLLWIARLNTNDVNTTVRVGISNDATSQTPTDGAYLEKLDADTNWFFVGRSASVQTRTDSGIAVGTGWFKLRIRKLTASSFAFSLDTNAEIVIASNVPGTAVTMMAHIANSAAAAKNIDVDYAAVIARLATPR